MLGRIVTFLKEARVELRKVTWPSREDTIRFTMAVIIVSGAVAFFLGGLDFAFQYILNRFIL